MQEQKVQLLYCHYGWSPEKIAAQLNMRVSVVRMLISDHQWEEPKDLIDVTEGLPVEATQLEWLKKRELDKQSLLSPLLAMAELQLVSKVADAINNVDTTRDDAHMVLSHLVKAYKTLGEGNVATHVVDATKDNPSIAIQVVNQM